MAVNINSGFSRNESIEFVSSSDNLQIDTIQINAMRKISLYTISLMYIAAGINHFWHQAMYLQIMPNWLGYHQPLVLLSGFFEIALGLLLLPLATRRLAAWGIILLLLAVFPANVQMIYNYLAENNPYKWLSIARLPLQIPLIWWAYTFTTKLKANQLPLLRSSEALSHLH